MVCGVCVCLATNPKYRSIERVNLSGIVLVCSSSVSYLQVEEEQELTQQHQRQFMYCTYSCSSVVLNAISFCFGTSCRYCLSWSSSRENVFFPSKFLLPDRRVEDISCGMFRNKEDYLFHFLNRSFNPFRGQKQSTL